MAMGMDELPRRGVKTATGALYFEDGFAWTAG
jgi:hypothetical protein